MSKHAFMHACMHRDAQLRMFSMLVHTVYDNRYVYICTDVCMYVCIDVYTHIHTYIHMCVSLHVCVYIYNCMYFVFHLYGCSNLNETNWMFVHACVCVSAWSCDSAFAYLRFTCRLYLSVYLSN